MTRVNGHQDGKRGQPSAMRNRAVAFSRPRRLRPGRKAGRTAMVCDHSTCRARRKRPALTGTPRACADDRNNSPPSTRWAPRRRSSAGVNAGKRVQNHRFARGAGGKAEFEISVHGAGHERAGDGRRRMRPANDAVRDAIVQRAFLSSTPHGIRSEGDPAQNLREWRTAPQIRDLPLVGCNNPQPARHFSPGRPVLPRRGR